MLLSKNPSPDKKTTLQPHGDVPELVDSDATENNDYVPGLASPSDSGSDNDRDAGMFSAGNVVFRYGADGGGGLIFSQLTRSDLQLESLNGYRATWYDGMQRKEALEAEAEKNKVDTDAP